MDNQKRPLKHFPFSHEVIGLSNFFSHPVGGSCIGPNDTAGTARLVLSFLVHLLPNQFVLSPPPASPPSTLRPLIARGKDGADWTRSDV